MLHLAIRVTNDGDVALDGVSFELLIPKNGIFNLNGDAWNPKGKWAQKLAVNPKPYDSSIDLLARLFQKGDPIGDYGTASIALQPYTLRF